MYRKREGEEEEAKAARKEEREKRPYVLFPEVRNEAHDAGGKDSVFCDTAEVCTGNRNSIGVILIQTTTGW